MPDPDGTIQNRDIADGIVTDRLLDADLTTASFTATTTFTGPYETSVAGTDTQRITLADGQLVGYTGDAEEVAPAIWQAKVSGSGDTRTLQVTIWTPSFLDDEGTMFFTGRSASFDDSNSQPGWVFGDSGGASTQRVFIKLQNSVSMEFGTDSLLNIPAETSDPSDPSDGTFWVHTGDNALYLWEGGAKRTIASW